MFPRELGAIAAAAAHVSSGKVSKGSNPYLPGSLSHTQFNEGFDEETKRIEKEKE